MIYSVICTYDGRLFDVYLSPFGCFLMFTELVMYLLFTSFKLSYVIHIYDWLPHRYFKPLVADVAVVAKCHLSVLYRHEKGKLFAQLVDLLQYYEGFEIDDNLGRQMTDDEVLQAHYERFQAFQLLSFKEIPKVCVLLWRVWSMQFHGCCDKLMYPFLSYLTLLFFLLFLVVCSWENLHLLTLGRFINVLIFQRSCLYFLLMNWGTWSAVRSVEELYAYIHAILVCRMRHFHNELYIHCICVCGVRCIVLKFWKRAVVFSKPYYIHLHSYKKWKKICCWKKSLWCALP